MLILNASVLHDVRQELKYRIAAYLYEVVFRLEVIGVCLLLYEYLAIPVAVINIMVEISDCCRGCIHTRCQIVCLCVVQGAIVCRCHH